MNRKWTEEETEFIANNYGIQEMKTLVETTGRSEPSIRCKMHAEKISIFDNYYSANLLAKELGVCHGTIMKYYHKRLIRGKKSNRNMGYTNPPMIFKEENIVNFLREHENIIDIRKIQHPYFKNIVVEERERKTKNNRHAQGII